MTDICPTITAQTKEDFSRQFDLIKPFAQRLHLDFSDNTLAPRQLLDYRLIADFLSDDASVRLDAHIMSLDPLPLIKTIDSRRVSLVIVHAEANIDLLSVVSKLRLDGFKAGVALLQPTSPAVLQPVINLLDHVLIFSGNLGYQGGSFANLELISKVKWLKTLRKDLEIGWDGGVNDSNAYLISLGGVDVLNVGGYLQRSADAKEAYAKLKSVIKHPNEQ